MRESVLDGVETGVHGERQRGSRTWTHAKAVSAAAGQSSDFSASHNGRGIDMVRGVSVL